MVDLIGKDNYFKDIANAFSDVKKSRYNSNKTPEQLKTQLLGELETAKSRKTSSKQTSSASAKMAAPGVADRKTANSMIFTARVRILANIIFSGRDAILALFKQRKE